MMRRGKEENFSIMRFKEIRFIKIVAIIVAVLFFQQQISWAQGGSAPVKSAVSQPGYDTNGLQKGAMDFEVPYHLADTSEIFSGGINEKIIHIHN